MRPLFCTVLLVMPLLSGLGCGAPTPVEPENASWCEALDILQAKCQRCHSNPTAHGAVSPLMSYPDTQRTLAHGVVWRQMRERVAAGTMPPLALELTPPVAALTSAERSTLLGWLDHGAPDATPGSCAR